jgi:hypothetical protein
MRTWAYERKFAMPVNPLPPNPSLEHLKHQAKDLLKSHAARDAAAAQRIREFHPRFSGAADDAIFAAQLKLSDAQLTIARQSGYPSWPRLKARIEKLMHANRTDLPHHERIEDADFRRAVDLLDAGDAEGLRTHLNQHPKLARQQVVFEGGNYFRTPTLLEFIAENPVRHGRLPANIVAVAEVILAAGVEQAAIDATLGLVVSGRVPRECGVQRALIDVLCDQGANAGGALRAAAMHGEMEAVDALLRRGARLDLPVAAALGQVEDFKRMLASASAEDRHLALAAAARFGRTEIVTLLLDAGEDPDRYNPVGSHAHSTPLHQAAYYGHESVVHLLVERGARLDIQDLMYQGAPADWAYHGGRTELEKYLRAKMRK